MWRSLTLIVNEPYEVIDIRRGVVSLCGAVTSLVVFGANRKYGNPERER